MAADVRALRQPGVPEPANSQLAKSRALLSAFYVTVLLATVAAALLPAVLSSRTAGSSC